jgi:hypothetical protein
LDVIINGHRYAAIPDELVPLIVTLAGGKGQGTLSDDGNLYIHMPLAPYRLVLDLTVQRQMPLPWETALYRVAQHGATLLERLGATVMITAGDDSAAKARLQAISDFQPSLVICLRAGKHISTAIRGLQAHAGSGPWVLRGRRLGKVLLEYISIRTGLPVRSTFIWPWLSAEADPVAARCPVLSVRLECGCTSCPDDLSLLESEAFQSRCSHGLVEGILRFLGVEGLVVSEGPAQIAPGPETAPSTPGPSPPEPAGPRDQAPSVPAPVDHHPVAQKAAPSQPAAASLFEVPAPSSRPLMDPHPEGEVPESMMQAPDGAWVSPRTITIRQKAPPHNRQDARVISKHRPKVSVRCIDHY